MMMVKVLFVKREDRGREYFHYESKVGCFVKEIV